MKTKEFKNGASVVQDEPAYNGMITIKLYTPSGNLHDRHRLDDHRTAQEYFKAFCAIAKNL